MAASGIKDYNMEIQQELNELENSPVIIKGKQVKPSQCYYFSTNPAHVLYNTNCPEHLKEKVDAILAKYKVKSQQEDDELIDIAFQQDGKFYNGWFSPSTKRNEKGGASSFSVVLNEVFFGHLSFQDCVWTCSEQRPDALVAAAGKQIELHYKL